MTLSAPNRHLQRDERQHAGRMAGIPRIHTEITGCRTGSTISSTHGTEGPRGDPHGVVKILTIDLGATISIEAIWNASRRAGATVAYRPRRVTLQPAAAGRAKS